MKKLVDKTWAKALFFCLMVVFAVMSTVGAMAIYHLNKNNVYLDGGKAYYGGIYGGLCVKEISKAYDFIYANDYGANQSELKDLKKSFRNDFADSECAIEVAYKYYPYFNLSNYEPPESNVYTETRAYEIDNKKVSITAYLDTSTITQTQEMQLMDKLISMRYALVAAEMVSICLLAFSLIFTLSSAGHWEGYEGIHLTWYDRIPVEIWIVVLAAMIRMIILYQRHISMWCFLLPLTVFLFFLPAFAASCKAGRPIKDSLTVKVLHLIVRVLKGLGNILSCIPLIWKNAVGVFLILLIDLLCVFRSRQNPEILILMMIVNCAAGGFLIYLSVGWANIQRKVEALAKGDNEDDVDAGYLLGGFRAHAETLDSIRDGISKALEQQMKSERMKTELITNVSHDLKTPITSIINYVDLLKKENIEDPAAIEYIEVLDRQAARLKKLTDDLVEASRAASGNIRAELSDTDVNVFLGQVVGEYEQRLSECELEPVFSPCMGDPHILSDGRLLWRVFDNLMGNVCKYAMKKTRVYLNCEKAGNKVVITLKNISEFPLNISADELMERFVRGDESRSTEGSGLGLSIAVGLTNAQNGELKLSVDGDLFKVQVIFDVL